MIKLILTTLVALSLLVGCVRYSNCQPIENDKENGNVSVSQGHEKTLENALKKFKHGKVIEKTVTKTHVNLVIDIDEKHGVRGEALGVVNNTKKFIEALPEPKPETVTVGVMHEDQRVLQFTVKVSTGEKTLEKAHPQIEKYLKKLGHFK